MLLQLSESKVNEPPKCKMKLAESQKLLSLSSRESHKNGLPHKHDANKGFILAQIKFKVMNRNSKSLHMDCEPFIYSTSKISSRDPHLLGNIWPITKGHPRETISIKYRRVKGQQCKYESLCKIKSLHV